MVEFLFYTLYNTNPVTRNRLNQLLFKFTYKSTANNYLDIVNIINSGVSDEEFIEKLKKIVPKMESEMDSIRRGKKFGDEWYKIIKPLDIKYTNYLDIGCNTGSITVEFAKNLQLKKSNIFGIDLEWFTEKKIEPVSGFNFQVYDGLNIPFEDNKFDIITCSMVLHHVDKQNILLSEIRRVLKKDGIFFIKEHNATDNNLENLIKLEHLLFDTLSLNTKYSDFLDYYFFKGLNKDKLKLLMKEYNFKQIKITDPIILEKYYKFNPTKHYYHIWKKN